MKQIYIIKTGDTLPEISERFSDFEDWIIKGLQTDPDLVSVFDAVNSRNLPGKINVHVSHSQTVITLPPGAVRLAGNDFEFHHAFRIGDCAWGLQFHPEYDEAIMKAYISGLAHTFEAVQSRKAQLLAQVKATPYAALLLARFGRLVKTVV